MKPLTKKKLKRDITGNLFILPVVLGILIFSVYPMISSFIFSFFKTYNGISAPKGFGLFNYEAIFRDKDILISLRITFLYALVTVPGSMILSFVLALFLKNDVKGIGVYRVLCYMPVIIPATVLGMLYVDFFDPRFGLANNIFESLGLPQSQFFKGASSALPTLMFTNLWGIGGGMILWLSSLKNVPESLYEAAKIDGAGFFKRLFVITVPMCSTMIFYNLIMGIIGSLQNFGLVFIVTGGTTGVDKSLMFYAVKIYLEAFSAWKMGYASALAWVLFLIIIMLTMLVFKTNKWVYYGDEN